MKKRGRTRFTVEGNGEFPIDMLRYDHAWPEHEHPDSYNVAMRYDDGGEKYLKLRRVSLLTDSPNAPTEGRWQSFTWRVVPGSIERAV